jgi:imidazolonepropionase-like amidohydrolase
MRTVHRGTIAALPLALVAAASIAHGATSDDDDRWVAVKCGKLITGVPGEEKEKVTLLVKNGKVEAVGEKVDLPFPCEVIDASGMTVMPGHVHVHSRLSLLDYMRGGMRADVKVADEFFPTADAFDVALAAGFTTLQLAPPGTAGIPGRCLVIRTADVGAGLVVDEDGAVKANLLNPAQDRRMLADSLNGAKKEIEKAEKARADFDAKKKAAEEQKKKEEEAKKQQGAPAPGAPPQGPPGQPPQQPPSPQPQPNPKEGEPPKPPEQAKPPEKPEEFQAPPIPPPLQPFVDLIQKKPGSLLFVRLSGATSWLHFLEATKDFDVAHVLYPELTPARGRPQAFFGVGGTDLQWVAKQVGEKKELLVFAPYLSYSQGSTDYVNVPKEMAAAGARVALTPANDSPDELSSWRFNVAELVKGGLKRADALAAMTKHAGEAIGLGDRIGTLEPGRDANLLLLTGDPFDVQTTLDRVLIEGKVVWTKAKKARS